MTRLTAIELVGFKSFADRTRFEFPDGITAIVGPNGSGKSNVVDAIKWVLGEQSVKSLRGKEMADVIFAGSAGRKPLNSAETSLVFDNSAGLLPTGSTEVRITRRVYRSGENEYLVNGQIARLRDIRDLLSGSGAASEGYSVIEQGRVDALLVASGRDRRLVFEEAAGITRFRSRRAEALRRLERTEQNRQRLGDLLGEIAGRLATVRQQATRARRHQEVTARLKSMRLTAASIDLSAVEEAAAVHSGRISRTREEMERHDTTVAEATARIAAIGLDEQSNDTELATAQDALAAYGQKEATARAAVAMLAERRREIDDETGRTARERTDCRHRLSEAEGRIGEAEREVATRSLEVEATGERLAAHERMAGTSSAGAAQVRETVAAARRFLREAEAAHADRRTAVVRLEDTAARLAESIEQSRAAVSTARERHAQSLDAVAAGEGGLAAVSERLDAAQRELASLEVRERELADLAIARREALASFTARLEACRERASVLEELVGRREGVSESIRSLLAAGVPGGRGLVAECVDADPSVAGIVDAALGSLAGHLLVEPSEELFAWLADLHAGAIAGGGRAGFVLADRLPDPQPEPTAAEGLVGRLDRLLLPPPAPGTAAEKLLGRIWVVQSLAAAASLAATAPVGTLFVTTRGETLSADGRLEIGSGAGSGLVSRRSELAAIPEKIAEIDCRAEACRREIADVESLQAGVRDSLRTARGRFAAESAAIASSKSDLDRARREAAARETAIVAAEASLRGAEGRFESVREQLGRARDAEREAVASVAAAAGDLARAEADAEAFDRSRGETIETVARLRVEEAGQRQRLLAASAALEARRAECRAARDALDAADHRLESLDARRRQHDLEWLARSADLADACWHVERLAVRRDTLLDARDLLAAARTNQITAADLARDAIASLSSALHEAELAAGEVRHRRERIVERIRDDYGLDIDAERSSGVVPQPYEGDRDSLEREIEDHRRRLAAMPSVNLEAMAEAEELERRHDSMQAQLADIVEARQAIEALIAQIDDESRRLLGETIETVRGHFRGLFESLFGGGQADIVLDPNVDLLETTVEIVARPPGKEPRNISLLSGGEKTMTCVALLLAIFKSRPSSFCVLDEVDAALDEANVDRFVAVLRDFLSSTQFILVTHSKKTMAAADNLYGVTMEESGVSKRVAVRLERARAALLARAA